MPSLEEQIAHEAKALEWCINLYNANGDADKLRRAIQLAAKNLSKFEGES